MIAGGFDLSVGAIYAAGASVYTMEAKQMALPLAALVALAVGLVCGALNGIIVTRLKVNPFVATLGTTSIFAGAAYLYSHSAPVLVDRPVYRPGSRKMVWRSDFAGVADHCFRSRRGGAVKDGLWPFALCGRWQPGSSAPCRTACRTSQNQYLRACWCAGVICPL
jgi:Branched-chain amino acid transport system / permease component